MEEPESSLVDREERKRKKKARQREDRAWVRQQLQGEKTSPKTEEATISISEALTISLEVENIGQPGTNTRRHVEIARGGHEIREDDINQFVSNVRENNNRQHNSDEQNAAEGNELPRNDPGLWLTGRGGPGSEEGGETPNRRPDRRAGRFPPRWSQKHRRENGQTVISPLSPLLDTGFSDGTPRFDFQSQPTEYGRPVRPHTPVVNIGEVRTPQFQFQEEHYPPVGSPSPVYTNLLTR